MNRYRKTASRFLYESDDSFNTELNERARSIGGIYGGKLPSIEITEGPHVGVYDSPEIFYQIQRVTGPDGKAIPEIDVFSITVTKGEGDTAEDIQINQEDLSDDDLLAVMNIVAGIDREYKAYVDLQNNKDEEGVEPPKHGKKFYDLTGDGKFATGEDDPEDELEPAYAESTVNQANNYLYEMPAGTVPVEKAVAILQQKFPGISGIRPGEEWSGKEGDLSIHLGDVAEGGEIDGLPGYEYNSYEFDPQEETYVMGVHRKLADALDELGYFAEPNDPGTLLAYPV